MMDDWLILRVCHLTGLLRMATDRKGFSRVLVLALLVYQAAGSSFVLEGSQTSYAQFRQWDGGLNSSIEFEFKTSQNNGLLLYTDNLAEKEYLMIKIVDGSVRLR